MAGAGRKQDYDYLIKLLLIGDSGEQLSARLRRRCFVAELLLNLIKSRHSLRNGIDVLPKLGDGA